MMVSTNENVLFNAVQYCTTLEPTQHNKRKKKREPAIILWGISTTKTTSETTRQR